jgi:hypothetical protein
MNHLGFHLYSDPSSDSYLRERKSEVAQARFLIGEAAPSSKAVVRGICGSDRFVQPKLQVLDIESRKLIS